MTQSLPCCLSLRFGRWLYAGLLLAVCGAASLAQAAQPADSPVLLSESTSTRAIALESVSMRNEPFSLNASVPYSADQRTRVEFFVMNLNLLAGEGANALTADAEDAAHNRYPLSVEYVGQVPGFEGIYMIVVRLNDSLGDVGDVLVRLNLHGVASNRVRVGIGHVGGGPANDNGAVPTPAPDAPPVPKPAATPNPYTDPALAAGGDGVRFLEQATFGPTAADLAHLRSIGFRAYLDEQFDPTITPTTGYPTLTLFPVDNTQGCPNDPNNAAVRGACLRDNYNLYPVRIQFHKNSLIGKDQLRQRVAFALSEIMVVSGRDLNDMPSWMAPYLQVLDRNAFGNFRQLLYEMTLNPAMGKYLDMAGNTKAQPNENYAREVLQLFSVGLDQLNADGTPKLDAQGNRIPTYDQSTITNFARVFTGWRIAAVPGQQGVLDYINPMTVNENNHDTGQKVLLNGAVLPAGQNSTQDLNAAIDNIFNHPNVGPFISKELIHHLVTSNPSPAYVGRVAAAFNNNGSGVRGDMRAVITAILLDPEARGDLKTDPGYGHLREPALYITNLLRTFNATSDYDLSGSNGYSQTVNGANQVYSPGSANYPATMDQDLFRSPTVFNYFPSDYIMPGTADVYGPEFGILSTSTTLKRANFVNTLVFSGIVPVAPDKPTGTQLDFSSWESPGTTPQQLVDGLNALMMHGSMSSEMRNAIVQNVSNITASNLHLRAQTAIYLVATSAQYQVER